MMMERCSISLMEDVELEYLDQSEGKDMTE